MAVVLTSVEVLAAIDFDIQREHEYTMKQSRIRDPKTMLRILKLTKTFAGSNAQDSRALDTLTIAAEQGELVHNLERVGSLLFYYSMLTLCI